MSNNQINRSSQIPFDFDRYENELQSNKKANLAKDILLDILKDISSEEYLALLNAFSNHSDPIESFAKSLNLSYPKAQARIQQHFKKIAKAANPQIIQQILSR